MRATLILCLLSACASTDLGSTSEGLETDGHEPAATADLVSDAACHSDAHELWLCVCPEDTTPADGVTVCASDGPDAYAAADDAFPCDGDGLHACYQVQANGCVLP